MRDVTFGRRRLLAYAGLMTAAAATAGCAASPARQAPKQAFRVVPPEPPHADPTLDDAESPVIRRETVYSAYRRTDVQLFTAHPTGVRDTRNLPMVVYLHGRDGVQPTPVPYQTLAGLEREYRNGTIPPFGFVSVDGGFNPYWYDGSSNGDLLSMLTRELPGWLRERDLGDGHGYPYAAAGLSTGGFGALNYAIERNRVGRPLEALAELAPALPVTWEHMQEKAAFDSSAAWQAADPLQRLDQLGDVSVGVWIGDADPYLEGATQLVDQHPNSSVLSVVPGGHEPAVFEMVGTDMVQFLADAVPLAS